MRTERELTHARKAHAQARERRRVAASHRGVVACVLLGVVLGSWVLGLLTALPWWPALVPTALLGASMAAGRRAAMASAAADGRERRRIAELERELMALTGRRPATPVVAATSGGAALRDARRRSGAADGAQAGPEREGAEGAGSVEDTGGAAGAGERSSVSASGAAAAVASPGSAASVTTVRASLPEILQELREENAERDRQRARRAAEGRAASQGAGGEAPRASRQEARGPLDGVEQAAAGQVEEQAAGPRDEGRGEDAHAQALAEIARAEQALRASAAASSGFAGRGAEDDQSAEGAGSAEGVAGAVGAGSAEGAGEADTVGGVESGGAASEASDVEEWHGARRESAPGGFHEAAESFEAASPAWSQIVAQGEPDDAGGSGASLSAERGARHSGYSGGPAAGRPGAGERRGADERRWSMSAEAAETAKSAEPVEAAESVESVESVGSMAARAAGRSVESGAGEKRGADAGGAARAAAPRRSIKKDALGAFPDKSLVKEPTTATPPQGWRPIQVPAPTYTLAARAPRRVFAEPVVEEGASAPVPARPQSVRTFSAPDFSEQDFHPIDLDAILERRRAAGE